MNSWGTCSSDAGSFLSAVDNLLSLVGFFGVLFPFVNVKVLTDK